MNLPHLCTSLELSKRLKELGCNQDSVFSWKHNTMSPTGPIDEWFIVQYENGNPAGSEYHVSAYTAGELGEMDFMKKFNGEKVCHTEYNYVWKKWTCYCIDENNDAMWQEDGDTEADARALMLCYLLENGLIPLTK